MNKNKGRVSFCTIKTSPLSTEINKVFYCHSMVHVIVISHDNDIGKNEGFNNQ